MKRFQVSAYVSTLVSPKKILIVVSEGVISDPPDIYSTMCQGNYSDVASTFANFQLQAHWTASKACVEKHPLNGRRPASEDDVYSTFLYEYHARDSSFEAIFGSPYISFTCNHRAILRLSADKIQFSGHQGNTTYVTSSRAYFSEVDLSWSKFTEHSVVF